MIAEDIRLAGRMHAIVEAHDELEAGTLGLSICTFRYVPDRGRVGRAGVDLNALNKAIMERVQSNGLAFLTNAVVDGVYLLRACIVNFRTGEDDVRALLEEVVKVGRELTQPD